jgi:hypothetical protein
MSAFPIICLSAGMLDPKKNNNPIARLHLYLNYGLLGLATILSKSGHLPLVIHGRFESPENVVLRLVTEQLLPSPYPLLLSIPSSFALPWARRAVLAIRAAAPQTRIVVGGRWVVADDEAWIRNQLPSVDHFVPGLAENLIESIVVDQRGNAPRPLLRTVSRQPTLIPELDYALLDRWQDFQPSIEVSRGCGMHCTFCAEAEEPLGDIKAPRILAEEFVNLARFYNSIDIHPYLEASLFRPTTSWIQDFRETLHASDVALRWRTETRVDAISPRQIEHLARTGLRVLDLGLESASPRQLLAMKKTANPDVYLRRASELLRACDSANVWAKVNVLLHPGETTESINQTVTWLEAHRPYIKGLSVGPTILFRYGSATESLLREFKHLGASEAEPGALETLGFAHLHLSTEIPHDVAIEVSHDISRSFMSARDYYDLKSFSYLPRSFTWNDFHDLVTANGDATYPFQLVNSSAALAAQPDIAADGAPRRG